MPNCDFYALSSDMVEVLDFVFAQPGWQLVELASRHDKPLRTFRATKGLIGGFPTFAKQTRALYFHLHAESMGGRITSTRINFDPGAVPGATHRYDSGGWGLIQLYFGHIRKGQLAASHTSHNSELRAKKWAPIYEGDGGDRVEEWNWPEVTRVSGRLNRFLRGRATGKRGSRPVLPSAWEAAERGELELALNPF